MSAPAALKNDPNAVVQMLPLEFLRKTKAKRLKLQLRTPGFVEGTTSSWQLPQAGLANEIWVQIRIPITIAGTVTAGKFAGDSTSGTSTPQSYNPAPYSVINRVKFYNTASYTLRDLDGFHWYSWVRDRYGFDPMAQAGSYYSDDVLANVLGANTITASTIKPGGNIVAQAYVLAITLPMPVSYNHSGDRGLIVLGTENLFYNLDITWGTIVGTITATGGSSDLIKGLTGSGLSITVGTPQITVEMDYFMIPMGARGRLNRFTDCYMSVALNTQPITSTGLQTYLLPPNDSYTSVGIHCWNAGAPIASANITNLLWTYGGQVQDFADDLRCMQVRQAWLSQALPMSGKILYDMGAQLGFYMKRDDLAMFNDKSVTGLQIQFNVDSSVSLSNGQMTVIQESLKPFKQSA